MAVLILPLSVIYGQQAEKPVSWQPIKVLMSIFPAGGGMLDAEREEYANQLVALAVNRIRKEKASPGSLELGHRMVSLALQLSPRNKRAIVANFQLGKGMLPDEVPCDLGEVSFARLLVARGQLLEKQPGKANRELSRYLFQLATELDPKNEDAVYLSELRRLEHGMPDWSQLTKPGDRVAP